MGKFVIKSTPTGNFSFCLKAGNGEIIAVSETYTSKSACQNGIESIQKNAPIANIEDQTINSFENAALPKFEIFLDTASEFRFRLKAKNGEIIATSESYTAKASCQNGIESVRKNAPNAEVLEITP